MAATKNANARKPGVTKGTKKKETKKTTAKKGATKKAPAKKPTTKKKSYPRPNPAALVEQLKESLADQFKQQGERFAQMEQRVVVLEQQLTDARKRISDLEKRLETAAQQVTLFAQSLSADGARRQHVLSDSLKQPPPNIQIVDPEKVLKPGQPLSVKGIKVGFRVWVAYLGGAEDDPPRVLEAEVDAINTRQNGKHKFYVHYLEDDTYEEVENDQVFPLTDDGKRLAEERLEQEKFNLLKEEAYRAKLIVYLLTGDLSPDKMKEYGWRQQISMASIVGLNPFKDLKDIDKYGRYRLIATAAERFREMPKGAKLLKEAQDTLVKWEEAQKLQLEKERQKQESLRERAKMLRIEDERNNGRKLDISSHPGVPREGDLVLDYNNHFFRIKTVKNNCYFTEHTVSGVRKAFRGLEFKEVDVNTRTPVWTAPNKEGEEAAE